MKFAFGDGGNRFNRKGLRSFSDFSLSANSQEFKNQIYHIKTDFQLNVLIFIASVLCADNSGTHDDLMNRLVSIL